MSDLGVSVGTIGALSSLIRKSPRTKAEQEFRRFWQEAKARTNPLAAYLGVAPVPGEEGTAYYRQTVGSFHAVNGRAWAVLNLTLTFGELKT
jgi:hypothetical protein